MEGSPLKKLKQLAQAARERGYSPETNKPVEEEKQKASYEEAQEIMSDAFYGVEEVTKTFGINIFFDQEPEIPFSKQELKRAKELGQELILYVDKTNTGEPLTVEEIKKLYNNNTTSNGEIFVYSTLFAQGEPRLGWRLSEKKPFKESGNKNYLEQTEAIVEHLQKEIFPEGVPLVYQEAINEFEAVKESLKVLINEETLPDSMMLVFEGVSAKKLSSLKINQMCRENLAEVIYRLALHEKKFGERLLDSPNGDDIYYIFTNTCLKGENYILSVGDFSFAGITIDRSWLRRASGEFGVCFSRGI